MTKNMKRLMILLLPLMLSFNSHAYDNQPFQEFGDYKVYFSVFNSSFIQPDIAKAYNLTRGKDRALVNIALVKKKDVGDTEGLATGLKGHSQNLMQQRRNLDFMEINEQGAVYYLAPLRFVNEEILHFTIEVKPDANRPPLTVTFSKKLYVEH